MNKLKLLFKAVIGEFLVIAYKLKLIKISDGINHLKRDKKIIVSLTSYGRRIKKVVPYTIMSLLRQSMKPDMIILNIDKDKWNKDNIPKILKKLTRYGLKINYVTDIKSYTKLIPVLKQFHDEIIITVDDDIFYSKNLIENLYSNYKRNPNYIYSMRISNNPPREIIINGINYLFLTNHLMGTGGVLYPPHSLPPRNYRI